MRNIIQDEDKIKEVGVCGRSSKSILWKKSFLQKFVVYVCDHLTCKPPLSPGNIFVTYSLSI
jgi:hypothetical protein